MHSPRQATCATAAFPQRLGRLHAQTPEAQPLSGSGKMPGLTANNPLVCSEDDLQRRSCAVSAGCRCDLLKLVLGPVTHDARCCLGKGNDARCGDSSERRNITGYEPGLPAGTLEKPSSDDGRETAAGEGTELLNKRDPAGTKPCGK